MHNYAEPYPQMPPGQTIEDRNLDWSLVDLSLGARVARGILYIDRCYPSALSNMDAKRLDISLGDICVVGQIHGYFVGTPEHALGSDFLRAHGFLALGSDQGAIMWMDERDLNAAWRAAIWERQDRA